MVSQGGINILIAKRKLSQKNARSFFKQQLAIEIVIHHITKIRNIASIVFPSSLYS